MSRSRTQTHPTEWWSWHDFFHNAMLTLDTKCSRCHEICKDTTWSCSEKSSSWHENRAYNIHENAGHVAIAKENVQHQVTNSVNVPAEKDAVRQIRNPQKPALGKTEPTTTFETFCAHFPSYGQGINETLRMLVYGCERRTWRTQRHREHPGIKNYQHACGASV